ncbi:MAG TPA: helix-turn-helix domain-containing protein, partial [Chitinophagaceae bacterium]|nr:helix-turn-helix domain-containing protein [Chitinophagaceae bacterium]
NTLFQLAADLINQSGRSIFLTGKAGTGKTTFLKYIRQHCHKQMAVVAPTGVAAINAGGVTIHSFFQLPFSPFILESNGFPRNETTVNRHNLISRLRFTKEKRKVLQQLELLIIDEISMVRSDMMDAIDTVLRYFRKRPYEKFGGVQLLLIGDMFQLPPVIKDAEWKMLSTFYDSPYFFDSHVIKEEPPLYIEFDKIYRQSEEKFIRLLNQVRNNEVQEDGIQILEDRYQPAFLRSKDDGYIILTTHNEQARNTNIAALNQLSTPTFEYAAEIKDDFPQNAYPAEEVLHIKAGAQVMFIKNDLADRGKRYFNGKIGIVTRLEENKIFVQCHDEEEIEVCRERWDNIRYSVNKTSLAMDEELLGSFSQYPLRLAWAITIHKSQGLTFEKAIIDAGEAFAPGQVYVALSRCTSLQGLILKSKLKTSSLFTDQRIVGFSQAISSSASLHQELETARRHYQEKLLLSTFDFRLAINYCNELQEYLKENSASFNLATIPWLAQIKGKLDLLQETAGKFQSWLRTQFQLPGTTEKNTALQQRTTRAAAHFVTEIDTIINDLQQSPAVTDSRLHAKEYNEELKGIFAELSATKHLLQGLTDNFSSEAWHQRKRNFVLPPFTVNSYAATSQKKMDSPHPALFMQLKHLRDSICLKKDLPIYIVAGSITLDEMARYLPQNLGELRKISGFGDAKIDRYGQQFLDIILTYCEQKDLHSLIHEKSAKREGKDNTSSAKKKGQSHSETFRLFREGRSVSEIAKERNLATSTIEGHLAKLVSLGEIEVSKLVSREKIVLIESALEGVDGTSITPIKQKLNDDISFGEIRLVMASLGLEQHKSAD